MDLTVVIPFYNGHPFIARLLASLPATLPVIVVDDVSDTPFVSSRPNVKTIRLQEKGYFAGAVNAGLAACATDVLVLNQDTTLTGTAWLELLAEKRADYAMIGERIAGEHPAWPAGYIHGTFMFLRRDAITKVGPFNGRDYPLWGNTCEWQLRAARAGFRILPLPSVPGFKHHRQGGVGESIRSLLDGPDGARRELFIRTPPEISVVVSCYNYGRYLPDLVHSLIGGPTSLGFMPGQTFASFEVVIVDDGSTDDSWAYCQQVANPWQGIRAIRRVNGGTAAANNTGIAAAHGKYIAVMNADDMLEPGRLERLYRVQLANPHRFVYDQVMAFGDGQRRPEQKFRVSPYDFEKLLYQNHVHAGIMFPKAAWAEVGGYPEAFRDGREDWAMNIALGLKGWCGVMVPEAGYLYRRERQNRTLTNTSPEHHKNFLLRLVRTFPRVYAGERPSMCCGNGPAAQAAPVSNSPQRLAVPGGAGTLMLEYVGGSYGTQSFYGPVTGARYSAGRSRPYVAVDLRDATTGRPNRPGLLEIRENEKAVFRPYVPPVEAEKTEGELLADAQAAVLETTEAFSPDPPAILVESAETVSLSDVVEVPDVNALTAKDILALDVTAAQAAAMLAAELAGKKRSTVVAFLESKANG